MIPPRLNGILPMLRKLLNIVALGVILVASPLVSASEYIPPEREARGDASAAAQSAVICSACHGAEGQAILNDYPNLGGQHYDYLLRQLRHFKDGERYAVLMAGQVDNMTDDQLKDPRRTSLESRKRPRSRLKASTSRSVNDGAVASRTRGYPPVRRVMDRPRGMAQRASRHGGQNAG